MKIKKNQMGFSGIEALIAIVIIAIVGALFAIEAGGRRLMLAEGRGYPVSTRQLSHNSAYKVVAAFENKRGAQTNYFAVLEVVEIFSSTRYISSGTNRLFALEKPLEEGGYIRVSNLPSTGVTFLQIDPPIAARKEE